MPDHNAPPAPTPAEHQTQLSEERTGLSHERTGLSHERTDLSHERTDLSLERTLLAHERTLMAWVRTATSLISFGFTIYKGFDYLEGASDRVASWLGPREFAMAMIGSGLTGLVLATVDHQRSRHHLQTLGAPATRSLALVMAVLVAALGILGLTLAALRQ